MVPRSAMGLAKNCTTSLLSKSLKFLYLILDVSLAKGVSGRLYLAP